MIVEAIFYQLIGVLGKISLIKINLGYLSFGNSTS
jgi:hypothetical protein